MISLTGHKTLGSNVSFNGSRKNNPLKFPKIKGAKINNCEIKPNISRLLFSTYYYFVLLTKYFCNIYFSKKFYS